MADLKYVWKMLVRNCALAVFCALALATTADALRANQPHRNLNGKWLVECAAWETERPYMLLEKGNGTIVVSAGIHEQTDLFGLEGVLKWDPNRKVASGITTLFLQSDPLKNGRKVSLEIIPQQDGTLHGTHEFIRWDGSGREISRFKNKTIWRRKPVMPAMDF
jgi:hypothetical protein